MQGCKKETGTIRCRVQEGLFLSPSLLLSLSPPPLPHELPGHQQISHETDQEQADKQSVPPQPTLSAILTKRLNPSEDLRSSRAAMFWQKSLALVLDSTSKAWGKGWRGSTRLPLAGPLPGPLASLWLCPQLDGAPSHARHPPSEGASPELGTMLKTRKKYKTYSV